MSPNLNQVIQVDAEHSRSLVVAKAAAGIATLECADDASRSGVIQRSELTTQGKTFPADDIGRRRSWNDEPLERSICKQGKSVTTTGATSNAPFESDLMEAIGEFTKEGALPLAKLRPGSFAAWVSDKPARDRIQNWHIYYGDLLKQSWLATGGWESNDIGLLLSSDIISYAVTQLPLKFAKDCRCRLFGSPANRFAAAELLIIGYALWQPQGEVYFNPYSADRHPMLWSEILDIESRRKQSRRRRQANLPAKM